MRLLTVIDTSSSDSCHTVGQELIRPFSISFGHSFQIEAGKIERNLEASNLKKIIVIALAILFLPITLLCGCLGAILLQRSVSHKMQYDRIQEKLYPIYRPPPKATDKVSDYSFDVLKKLADGFTESPYVRSLISSSVYEVETRFNGDTIAHSVYPNTPEKITKYQQKIPDIICSVRENLESILKLAIPISELKNVIEKHFRTLFPFVF